MDKVSNLSQPISVSEPQKSEVVVSKRIKPNYTLSIVLIFGILGLLGFQVYAFLTGKLDIGIENPLISEEVTEEDQSSAECEVCIDSIEQYTLKNSGWALYDLDEYEFSAELPTYTMTQSIDGNEAISFWNVGTRDLGVAESAFYTDYIDTISVRFIPDDTRIFECGGGCAKEHSIDIHVFENNGPKNLLDVSSTYLKNLEDDRTSINENPIVSQKEEQKWGHQVISFTEETPSDVTYVYGDIVVTSKFVYVVRYYLSSTPTESYQIAQKVLDSFTFGK